MNTAAKVRKEFINRYGDEPLLVRAPGRINLIGEHTDYNDGFVMPAAIDREIVFAFGFSPDATIRMFSVDEQEEYLTEIKKLNPVTTPHWVNYLLGVVARLLKEGHSPKPFQCVFGGDIPVGAGLSSSAALECGFIYGLDSLNGFGLDKIEMVKWAQWAEHTYAGVKCGIMDQFASMMGKKDHVLHLDCRSLEYSYFPLSLPDLTIVLLDTRVKHSLASSEYNIRRSECEAGVTILKEQFPEINSLRDVPSDAVQKHRSAFPPKVFDRCLYVTQEIERVQHASQDLLANDFEAFGKKMYETHEGLSALYEVSCAELDFLVAQARKSGVVVGSRMMGGGFGGCTINLVRSNAVDSFVESGAREFEAKFGSQLEPYVVQVKDGVSRL